MIFAWGCVVKLYMKALFVMVIGAGLGWLNHIGWWPSAELGELRTFFAVFGLIYGIVSGFVLVQVLRNYSDIKAHISGEINALQDIRDYLGLLDLEPETVDNIRDELTEYVESVVEIEWRWMGSRDPVDMDTSAELYDVLTAIHRIEPNNATDTVALKKLVDLFGQITTHRTQRLAASRDQLPSLLRHLIFILSLVVIGVFTWVPFSSLLIGVGLKAVIAFAISFVFLIIADLNRPFAGKWHINDDLFEEFRDQLLGQRLSRTNRLAAVGE